MKDVNLDFIRNEARAILDATTIEYVKTAQLHGSLFHDDSEPGVVSSLDTRFFVHHGEPLAALKEFETGVWPLGRLLDGHEFLLLLPVQPSSPPLPVS